MDNKSRTRIITMVCIVWALNFTAPVVLASFEREFQPPAEINIAFMGIIGILTASYKRDSRDEGDE